MWLSLVVGPEQRVTAQTRTEMQQRYNVAVSRAQDQLWLFHSVTLNQLRQGDLRYSLLKYLTSTDAEPLPPMPDGVAPDRPHDGFDSLFEQRVFLDLADRGYHVRPQVETNGRLIDLVVTGTEGKLAVECDGDAFHTTTEQLQADLQREQELKRCGWTFVRVRESSYCLDRERALAPVWVELERLGIRPLTAWEGDAPDTAPVEPVEETDAQPELKPVPVPEDLSRLAEEDTHLVKSEPLPAEASGQAQQPAPPRQEFDAPTDERRALLLQAAQRSPLSSERVSKMLATSMLEARELLKAMVDEELLVRTGQTRTRYVLPDWTTTERHSASNGSSRGPRSLVVGPDQRSAVLRAVAHRPLTNEIVRRLLEVDSARATEILTALVEDGQLERKGQARGTYYVRAAEISTQCAHSARSSHAGGQEQHRAATVQDFEHAMGELCRRAESELSFRLPYLLRLLDERGALGAAQRILQPGPLVHGFVPLWEQGRLDLTVESLALEPRFRELFTEQELATARTRLDRS